MDVLACANFGPVLFVTLSYYTMRLLPIQEPIYGEDYRFQVLPAGVNPLQDGVRLKLTCLPCLRFATVCVAVGTRHVVGKHTVEHSTLGGTAMPAARPLMPAA